MKLESYSPARHRAHQSNTPAAKPIGITDSLSVSPALFETPSSKAVTINWDCSSQSRGDGTRFIASIRRRSAYDTVQCPHSTTSPSTRFHAANSRVVYLRTFVIYLSTVKTR